MKFNIPNQIIALTCPSCESSLFSINEDEIAICGTCDLKLHKNELIEQNNISDKVDTNKITTALTKEMQKMFKGKGWK